MTPTRTSTLLALAVTSAALTFLLVLTAYGSLPRLSLLGAFSIGVLAVAELAMARVVRSRLRDGRTRGRALHPLQVARAAVLAKASSAGGALLLGGYTGMLVWALPRRDELLGVERAAAVAGVSAVVSLALVAAALLLERACRTPPVPGLGSRT